MLWLQDVQKWNQESLTTKLEKLRKHYCTGPCGQSNAIIQTRDATNAALQEAITKLKKYEFILDLSGFIAEHDICGMVDWRTDGKYYPITFHLNTNDLFVWGSADSEEINESNLSVFKQSILDCIKIDSVLGAIEGCSLFAARMNKMRPQGAAYPECKELWPLFDACGPEREINFANPCKPGDYKR